MPVQQDLQREGAWPGEEAAYMARQEAHLAMQQRQYSQSIEMLLQAVAHDPGRRLSHDRLFDVALRRARDRDADTTITPPRVMPRVHPAVAKLIEVERQWAYNPLDEHLQAALIEQLLVADRDTPELGLRLVARWFRAEMIGLMAHYRPASKPASRQTLNGDGQRTVA